MRKQMNKIKALPQQDPWSLRPGQHLPLLNSSPSSDLREDHHLFNSSEMTEISHEIDDSKLSSGLLSNSSETTEISRDSQGSNLPDGLSGKTLTTGTRRKR